MNAHLFQTILCRPRLDPRFFLSYLPLHLLCCLGDRIEISFLYGPIIEMLCFFPICSSCGMCTTNAFAILPALCLHSFTFVCRSSSIIFTRAFVETSGGLGATAAGSRCGDACSSGSFFCRGCVCISMPTGDMPLNPLNNDCKFGPVDEGLSPRQCKKYTNTKDTPHRRCHARTTVGFTELAG